MLVLWSIFVICTGKPSAASAGKKNKLKTIGETTELCLELKGLCRDKAGAAVGN